MLKRQLSSSVLPSLEHSRHEQVALKKEVAFLRQQMLDREQMFQRQNAKVDPSEWKKISSCDNFHVYKERQARWTRRFPVDRDTWEADDVESPEFITLHIQEHDSKLKWIEKLRMEEEDTESIALDTKDTFILGTGHMDGSLEDAMYGLYDGDEASWSLQTALTNDRLADSRILTTIHSPTHDKPFRFLGVKWFETAIPSVISAFARKRDTLALEAMGLTTDEFGDSYGYYVLNDYQHPSIPELSDIGIIRSKLSICYIFRQASFGRVSIYARVSVDVGGGDLMRRVGVIVAAESIALTAKAIDTAHAKKLHWLVQQHQVQRSDGSSDPSLSPSSSMDCESCQKTTGCSLLSPRLTTCHACRGSFCSRCTVERNLADVDAGVQVRSHVFCFGCVLRANLQSATSVSCHHVSFRAIRASARGSITTSR